MRITNSMLSNDFLTDMNVNLENMAKIDHQMSTLKNFSKPSDDPIKVARAMQLHTDINTNKQYNVNIKSTIGALDTTDTALGQAGNVLQRINELLISAGGVAGVDEKKAIKDEINQKISEFAQIMNTNFDGKYLFGGTRSTTKPMDVVPDGVNTKLVYYKTGGGELSATQAEADANVTATAKAAASALAAATADPADPAKAAANIAATKAAATAVTAAEPANVAAAATEYKQIASNIKVEISQGVTVEYNVCASDMLQFTKPDGTKVDLRTLFSNIVNHLDGNDNNGDPSATAAASLTSEDLQGIQDAMNNLLSLRAEVGAKENRMDSAKINNEDENFNLTNIVSSIEDVNITEKTMESATMQTIYTAALQTSAKVIQPSLLDYLR